MTESDLFDEVPLPEGVTILEGVNPADLAPEGGDEDCDGAGE